MNQAKKLLLYLVINVVVSLITILGVWYLLENTRLKTLFNTAEQPVPISSSDPSQPAEEVTEELLIEIGEVFGVGNLATEYVHLIRSGSDSGETISLQEWHIRDENNHNFNILEQSGLASLELHSQGAVNIYSKEGDSSPVELYLDLSDPIWEPGETVTLIDPNGEVHDTYLIPR